MIFAKCRRWVCLQNGFDCRRTTRDPVHILGLMPNGLKIRLRNNGGIGDTRESVTN